MNTFFLRRSFSFFNKKISNRKSKLCCRYNQDGKPLDPQTVISHTAAISEFIKGWKFNENYTRMQRVFYARDYLMAVQFVKDIAKMDALSTRNCPSFSIQSGDFVKVELFSPSLDGLSQIDFRVAMEINNMKFDEYYLIPVENEKNYRREAKLKMRDQESEELQKKLAQDEGSAKKGPEQKIQTE